MATVKAVFLLPLRDNDHRELSAEIEAARDAVYDRFHGLTREGVGLFAEWWETEEERQTITQSALFKQANRRLTELEFQEEAPLRSELDRINAALREATATDPSTDGNSVPTHKTTMEPTRSEKT